MVELVDALDLGSSLVKKGTGSNPVTRSIVAFKVKKKKYL